MPQLEQRPFLIHALSPLHAGTGQSADVVDQPIARMSSTGIPIVPGSSIKGTLRDARRGTLEHETHRAVFGPDKENASEHTGALQVSDARLLALPVQSFRGTFALVTSPLLLRLLKRDLESDEGGGPDVLPDLEEDEALGHPNNRNTYEGDDVVLEEINLSFGDDDRATEWAETIATWVDPEHPDRIAERMLVVHDETMTFLWESATQVDTRIAIDNETRTVEEGKMWVEESLPPESLLVGLLGARDSLRDGEESSASEILNHAMPADEDDEDEEIVEQFGGHTSVGRGRCRVVPIE